MSRLLFFKKKGEDMLRVIAVFLCALLLTGNCFAQTAGNASDPKIPYGPGIANMQASGLGPFKASFDADWVFDRDLDEDDDIGSAELEGQKYLMKLAYTINDRWEPYIKMGVSHLKSSWKEDGFQVKTRGENGFAFGIGGKALVREIPEYGIRFTVDAQYLYTDPDIKSVHIEGVERTVSATEFKVSEWQLAGICSKEFIINGNSGNPATPYSLVPYMGIAYTDSKTDVQFTSQGNSYDLGKPNSNDKFVFLTGCDVTSPENFSLNVEGRFIGETAASGGCTLKF